MAKENDEKILQLKAKIEEKKNKLENLKKKFIPITNCSLELSGIRYNLHTLNKENIITLLVSLNCYKMSAENLNLLDKFVISGHKVIEWISDLQSRLDILSIQDEERNLKQMEKKLSSLLSEDKTIELEIDSIEKLLKD